MFKRIFEKNSRLPPRGFLTNFFQSADVCLTISGLSALAVEAYGFTLVRAFVRACVTPYLEIRASDFDDFLHKATS